MDSFQPYPEASEVEVFSKSIPLDGTAAMNVAIFLTDTYPIRGKHSPKVWKPFYISSHTLRQKKVITFTLLG